MARTRATRRRGPRRARRRQISDQQYQENNHQLDKLPQKIPTFLEDPQNPYHRAPKQIQDMFDKLQERIKFLKKEIKTEQFKPILQAQEMCMNNVQQNSYICYTCFPGNQFRVCHQCFDKEEHQKHYYISYFSDDGQEQSYCICGKTSPKSYHTCKKHQTIKQISKLEIPELNSLSEKEQQTINFYIHLFKIVLYLYRRTSAYSHYSVLKNQLLEFIKETFHKCLKQNSAYFMLGMIILDEKVAVKPSEEKYPVTILQYLLRMNFLEFVAPFCSNSAFCVKLYQKWFVPENKDVPNLKVRGKFPNFQSQILEYILKTPTIIPYLYKNNLIFPNVKILERRLKQENLIDENGNNYLIAYLQKTKKCFSDPQQYINFLFNINQSKQLEKSLVIYILKEIFSCLMGKVELEIPEQKKQKSKEDENSEEGEEQQNNNEQNEEDEEDEEQSDKQQQTKIQQAKTEEAEDSPEKTWKKTLNKKMIVENFSSVNYYLLFLADCNIEKVGEETRLVFRENGLGEKLVDEYLFMMVGCREKEGYINRIEDVVFLYLANASPYRQRLFHLFCRKYYQKQNMFLRSMNSTLDLIKNIANTFVWSFSYATITQQKQEILQNYLRSYLYKTKSMSYSDLVNIKYERNIQFCLASSEKIIKELCDFVPDLSDPDEDLGDCIYVSENKYPNDLCKLDTFHRDIFNSDFFTYDSVLDLSEYPNTKNLLQGLLSCEYFLNQINKDFDEYLKSLKNNERELSRCKERQLALKFLYFLVLQRILGNEKLADKNGRLKQLKQSEEVRTSYLEYCDRAKLLKLLSIQQKQIMTEQQIKGNAEKEKQQFQKLKEKAKNKKQKMKQKYKNKIEHILDLHATKSITEEEKQVELCLFCREAEKPDNPFAYTALVNKNKTLSFCLFGNDDVSKISISSCFHSIHLLCFTKLEKKNGYFTCMLCQKQCNTLVPRSYEPGNTKVLKICQNILTANFVYNYDCLEVESLFMIFFKYLIESKSLNIFSYGTRFGNQSYLRDKIDAFASEFLESIYQKSSVHEKALYVDQMHQFFGEFSQCVRPELKMIQSLIYRALQAHIIGSQCQINQKQVQELAELLDVEDFEMVKQQLQALGAKLQKTNVQIIREKQPNSLVFQPIIPPDSYLDLPQFGEDKCGICDKKDKNIICLICGKTICRKCHDQEKHDKHQGRSLFYRCIENQLTVKCNNRQNYECLYRSVFRLPLNQISFSNHSNKDQYKIEKHKLQKFLKIFFEEA